MSRVGNMIITDTAEIVRVSDRCIEQTVKPDAILTSAAIARNAKARRKVAGGKPYVLLIVIPAEVPVDPDSTNVDHYRYDRDPPSILALALVVQSATMSAVVKFYFRYYPQPFEVRVFEEDGEARSWLGSCLLAQGGI